LSWVTCTITTKHHVFIGVLNVFCQYLSTHVILSGIYILDVCHSVPVGLTGRSSKISRKTHALYGCILVIHSEKYQVKNNKAQEFGFQSAERAGKWAEVDKLGFSPDELLARQNPIEQPEKSVPNPERRRKGGGVRT
jgi:hypothetical protein